MINLSYFLSGSSNRVDCQGVKHDSDSGRVLDGSSIARFDLVPWFFHTLYMTVLGFSDFAL